VTDATTIEPHPPGLDELHTVRKVAGREVGMRRSVYPKWVRAQRMTAAAATDGLYGMGMAVGLARGVIDLWPHLTAIQQHDLQVAMIAGGREARGPA
jgi:hypothetical protein